jgi:hypothetical protein
MIALAPAMLLTAATWLCMVAEWCARVARPQYGPRNKFRPFLLGMNRGILRRQQ